MTDIDAWTNDIHTGDARDTLAELPESSVHMVMTSPPYFGLRDYGVDGQIGLEESLDEYIAELVNVFREVRRVLRPDGSLWLNLGDTYDDKDLQQIPARVALELQSRGWILRNRVTWAKPNPMPQSVKDRLNDTTEAVFHFVKNKDYWYDLDAIREEYAESGLERGAYSNYSTKNRWTEKEDVGNDQMEMATEPNPAGKNPGDVFEVTTKPFPDAHFAVYPPELCEKPLKATCPPKVCAECGAPYERDVERSSLPDVPEGRNSAWENQEEIETGGGFNNLRGQEIAEWKRNNPDEFKGWTRTCDCDTEATEAGIALDPFAGAGTTCLVAKNHGRRFIGIDLNDEYVAMAQKRLGLTVDNPEYVRDDDDAGLEEWT